MESTVNMQQIISEVEKLDYESKINLMARILSLLKKDENKTASVPITKLKGLGKGIWKNIDIESYLKREY